MSKTPPHDVNLERIVLGSMMLMPAVVDEVSRVLTRPSMFYHPPHQPIFKAIIAADKAGDPVEPYAIMARLSAAGELTRVGGAPYLLELVQAVPVAAQAPFYARKVRDLATARDLAVLAVKAHDLAHSVALEDPASATERIRQGLDALEADPASDDFADWEEIVDAGLNALEPDEGDEDARSRLEPVSTGIPELDAALNGGLHPGQVIVVAGRTSMGKSVLARNFARAAAFHQKIVTGLFSIEMTKEEIFNAIVSAECELDYTKVNKRELSDEDWTVIARWLGECGDVPLFVDDSESITVAGIRAKARRLKQKRGLGLLIVDYLQLVEAAGRENRQVAVAEMSQGFRRLAKELRCPVVLLSQLNRGPEQRVDKRPNKADLRESGAIENDANVIILVHREDYYDKDSPRRGEADLIIAKNRAGQTQDVVVAAQLHLARFSGMAIA